jgi:hypothetical protein
MSNTTDTSSTWTATLYYSQDLARMIDLAVLVFMVPFVMYQVIFLIRRRNHQFIEFRGLASHSSFIVVCDLFILTNLLVSSQSSAVQCSGGVFLFFFFLVLFVILFLEQFIQLYFVVCCSDNAQEVAEKQLGITLRCSVISPGENGSVPTVVVSRPTHLKLKPWKQPRNWVHNMNIKTREYLIRNKLQVLQNKFQFFSRFRASYIMVSFLFAFLGILLVVSFPNGSKVLKEPVLTYECVVYASMALRLPGFFIFFSVLFVSFLYSQVRAVKENFHVRRELRISWLIILPTLIGLLVNIIIPQTLYLSESFIFVFFNLFVRFPVVCQLFCKTAVINYWMFMTEKLMKRTVNVSSNGSSRYLSSPKLSAPSGLKDSKEDIPRDSLNLEPGQYIIEESRRSETVQHAEKKSLSKIKWWNESDQTDEFLIKALQDDEMSRLFEQFLLREFSVENLLFYRATENFVSNYEKYALSQVLTDSRCLLLIKEFDCICRVFFTKEESSLQVNISYARKQKIMVLFKNLVWTEDRQIEVVGFPEREGYPATRQFMDQAIEALLDCQGEIFELMKTDSFHRFKRSETYVDWKRTKAAVYNAKIGNQRTQPT